MDGINDIGKQMGLEKAKRRRIQKAAKYGLGAAMLGSQWLAPLINSRKESGPVTTTTSTDDRDSTDSGNNYYNTTTNTPTTNNYYYYSSEPPQQPQPPKPNTTSQK